MKSTNLSFRLTLLIGIFFIILGLYLWYTKQSSTGAPGGWVGFMDYGIVNGPIAFSLGILCLLWSIGIYFMYKKKKKEYDEME
jgi:hypothetical protein